MKVRGFAAAFTLAGALAVSATAANATVVFDFGVGPNGHTTSGWSGAQGVSHTYTASGLSITATAFGPGTGYRGRTPDQLYGKHNGADENGLGMTNDPSGEHEIYYGDGFIQLDVSALYPVLAPGGSLGLDFNSTTGGEQWTVYGSNTAGVLGTAVLPTTKTFIGAGGTENTLLDLIGGYKYYDIESTKPKNTHGSGGNVLIESLAVDAVPEPASWALMITGVFCVGAALRQRRRAFTPA